MLDRYGAGGLTADKDDEDEPMSNDRVRNTESVSPEDLAQLKQHAQRYGGVFKYSNPTRTLFKFKRPADADGFAKDVEKIFKLKSQKDFAGSMVSVWEMSGKAESLIDRAVAGTPVDELVGELILGVQTPPPPMTDRERKKKRMGAGIEPESNKATYYPLDPGSQGWFET